MVAGGVILQFDTRSVATAEKRRCVSSAVQQQFQHHNASWNRSTEMKPESIFSWSCFMTHARTPFCPATLLCIPFLLHKILQQTWMHSDAVVLVVSRLSYSITFPENNILYFALISDLTCSAAFIDVRPQRKAVHRLSVLWKIRSLRHTYFNI